MTAKTKEDFIAGAQSKLNFVGDYLGVDVAEIITSLEEAVSFYSKDRPREKISVITGDGSNRYALPTDWQDDFSVVKYIEYPAGDNADQDPSILDQDEVLIWEDDTGKKFQFRFTTLEVGDTAWIKYTLPHTLTDSENSIPETDFSAVVYLTTALSALTAAGRLLKNRSQSKELVSFRTVVDEYKAYAQEMLKYYYKGLGINPERGSPPTLRIFDIDVQASSGVAWLTHPNR